MTKIEYLNILNERLGRFNKELRDEIMEDYNRQFAEVDSTTGQDKKYCYEGEYKGINLECDAADMVLELSENGKIQVDYKIVSANMNTEKYSAIFSINCDAFYNLYQTR